MGDQSDLYDYGDIDGDRDGVTTKTCCICDMPGLTWIETKNGWRLSEDGEKVHVCTPDVTGLFNVVDEEK